MSNKTIFVVDDDKDLREGIVEILLDHQFKAIPCESGEVALQKAKIEPPGMAIIDNMMPGMDGMAVIAILKSMYPAVKIIMITAFSTVDNAVMAMKSGADDYLSKPFKRDDLLVAVRRNLESLKFQEKQEDPDIDEALSCLANPIRRHILICLFKNRKMRFMDMSRHLGLTDHTKLNFHLKQLKLNNLLVQDRDKNYCLSPRGEKTVAGLNILSQKISE
jgi:DNA-binding response OmpR family regulator